MTATWLDILDDFLRIVAAVASFAVLFFILNRGALSAIKARLMMAAYARKRGRSLVLLTHGKGGGLFGGSMLTMSDVLKIEKHVRSAPGAVDLVLTTYGGEMIAGLRLARFLQRNPRVRLVVPKYAFSAGTIAAVGARLVVASPEAMFGPVDPQLGWFWDGSHSAKDWIHVAREKGETAKDATLATAETSRRLMDEMRAYLDQLAVPDADRGALWNLLLDGDVSHACVISPVELGKIGLPVTATDCEDAADIVERAPDGVRAFILKEKRAR